ncbi:hypothetical protein KP509_04G071000 [Ceratopteris richardii]|nr:hypothetical protein KP509_04G071000 [Ceratopteris richardii]
MCDGTNSFWCQNGICEEIVQGENYTCICKDGFAGEHCELKGTRCGDNFCYHNGECDVATESCACPEAWRGSADCTKPTVNRPQQKSTVVPVKTGTEDGNDTWFVPILVVVLALVVSGGVIWFARFRKRSNAMRDFHRLRQVQMQNFDDEDEDAFSRAPLSKAQLV